MIQNYVLSIQIQYFSENQAFTRKKPERDYFSFYLTRGAVNKGKENKTKDWALVQNVALVINIEVMELG